MRYEAVIFSAFFLTTYLALEGYNPFQVLGLVSFLWTLYFGCLDEYFRWRSDHQLFNNLSTWIAYLYFSWFYLDLVLYIRGTVCIFLSCWSIGILLASYRKFHKIPSASRLTAAIEKLLINLGFGLLPFYSAYRFWQIFLS